MRNRRLASTLSALLLAATATACSTTPRPAVVSPQNARAVDGGSVSDLQRELDEATPGSPGYAPLRDRVARFLATRALDALQTGDVDGALDNLRAALVHHTPAELSAGGLPDTFGPVARELLQWAEPRGDEVRALIASRLLRALQPPDPAGESTWREVTEWGQRNRQDFRRGWVREAELAALFRDVARVVPAQDVLEAAADHFVGWRREVFDVRNGPPIEPRSLQFDEARQYQAGLRTAKIQLALLFLRVGDLREAANRVTALGPGPDGAGVAAVLGSLAQGEGGADRLFELAESLNGSREGTADNAAVSGVCRDGRRRFPTDARFARCLALAAYREHDYGLTSAHLAAAARLRADDQSTLRVALEAAAEWLQREVGAEGQAAGRRAYARAIELLGVWRRRYEGQLPPVAEADLEDLAAQFELAAGDLGEARAHLERATRATPASREAFFTLSEIAWRHREGAEALRWLDEGQRLPLRATESDSLIRPMFALRRALATQVTDPAAARPLWEEALSQWEAMARNSQGRAQANAHLHRSTALDALGRHDDAQAALVAAVDAAPDDRDVAGRAIAFSLSRGQWRSARDLDQRARAQLTLDRPWQVYFALWGMVAARLGNLPEDGGAHVLIQSVSEGANEYSAWTVRLAQRYTGALDREGLLRYARTPGQRAEGLFYDAMLRLAAGETAGAEADLRAVLETQVLHYYEYEIAWEMLSRGLSTLAPATTTPMPTPPQPAAAATPATPTTTSSR
ncbi:MAG: hypothetical protein R3A52_27860 [Polyangiales bacterium]